ncbi:HAMP domain-containing protein [Plantactinospora sp. S1510]|uniref:histidine kinase n=1 Tax=Plantactinospora alkalitolerans TaxID=2789879 RepID=A0ABS0GY35_9ACTN|nr:ATP-binding protein [Plantactinospora alkalitolerans]MBF9130869.1 HAMP domain-containing protein [Plantactinospora alkalitolerans]
MSFRFRVLALVMLVAVSATAATLWLVLRQASQQIDESAVPGTTLDRITGQLADYGSRHGTWEGVRDVVVRLGKQTGQRIHLVSESGWVLVDTDREANPAEATRRLGTVVGLVNPRPTLDLSGAGPEAVAVTAKQLHAYRTGIRYAACLTRNGVEVVQTPGPYGIPTHDVAPGTSPDLLTVRNCQDQARDSPQASQTDETQLAACGTSVDSQSMKYCLAQAFNAGIDEAAPEPARVIVGVGEEGGAGLVVGPLLAAAAGVAAVAIIATALLSHRVLRPIGILTTASQRLGRGDLSSRVPVRGNDELATLARSFNRMADSLQRGEERQRRLVADVAHELRTPLANLRGYLEALSDGVIEPDPELFASLHEEAVLQQRIVDDLQELALAEAGSLAYHRTTVDLAELLETCRTAHGASADAAGVSLTVTAAPVAVYADPDRLRQVLGNLITNALRATRPGGGVTLTLERDAHSAVVRVVDTGSGIAPDALPHVFDRFWRADSARGRQTGGSGLGLAIVRQILTDHGGSIRVTSQLGVGTAVILTLPVVSV